MQYSTLAFTLLSLVYTGRRDWRESLSKLHIRVCIIYDVREGSKSADRVANSVSHKLSLHHCQLYFVTYRHFSHTHTYLCAENFHLSARTLYPFSNGAKDMSDQTLVI